MFGHYIIRWLEKDFHIVIAFVTSTIKQVVEIEIMIIVQFIIEIHTGNSGRAFLMTH